jgi:energy-converting hydrogenase Eha subunit E
MNSPDRLHRPFGALLAVEFRTVGMAIAREGLLALAAFLAVCVLTAVTAIRSDDRLEVGPELLLPVLPLSLILPWLVWKGDPVFGRALLWTLPVRRQRAAAAKVAAGALWLMLGVLLTFAGLALTTLASGGKFGCEEVRFLAPPSGGPVGAERVQWTTPVWAWLMPFGGALLAYTAGSAVLLGLRHPLRWLAGAASTLVLLGVLAVNLGPTARSPAPSTACSRWSSMVPTVWISRLPAESTASSTTSTDMANKSGIAGRCCGGTCRASNAGRPPFSFG